MTLLPFTVLLHQSVCVFWKPRIHTYSRTVMFTYTNVRERAWRLAKDWTERKLAVLGSVCPFLTVFSHTHPSLPDTLYISTHTEANTSTSTLNFYRKSLYLFVLGRISYLVNWLNTITLSWESTCVSSCDISWSLTEIIGLLIPSAVWYLR